MKELLLIFVSTVLINNLVLSYFLGICPFLGVSGKIESAIGMGMAVTFVMTLATSIGWLIYHLVLEHFGLVVLEYVVFILVIASLVQIVEMFIRKFSQSLYQSLGIYLPLITTNCAILGVSEGNITGIWTETMPYFEGLFLAVTTAVGTGLGFGLIMFAFSSIREKLEASNVPDAWKGVPISLVVAGIMSFAFFGLQGVI